jgi:IrrE N-terminal-like domain
MNPNSNEHQTKFRRPRASRARTVLSPWQTSLEHQGMRLRAQLNLSDWDSLDQFAAFNLIPKTAVWPLKNVPGITLHSLNYFRSEGIGWSAWAVPDWSGNTNVFFNDANPLREVRVHLLEEYFHLRLGHSPDKISLVPVNGNYRTYNIQKEEEAHGCGAAALVPYAGLQSMLALGKHLEWIAEHYLVPLSLVEFRIEATKLEPLSAAAICQLSLIS